MENLGFIGGLGIQEILIIVLIIALLFGVKNIPKWMRGMGEGMRELKRGLRGENDEIKN